MTKLLIRRREVEGRYPRRSIWDLLGNQPYENIVDGSRMGDGTWKINIPDSNLFVSDQHGHEFVTILINVGELRKDPNFPPDHTIWDLPAEERELPFGGKRVPEIEATAFVFSGYFRVNLPGTMTCFIHEHQVNRVNIEE